MLGVWLLLLVCWVFFCWDKGGRIGSLKYINVSVSKVSNMMLYNGVNKLKLIKSLV